MNPFHTHVVRMFIHRSIDLFQQLFNRVGRCVAPFQWSSQSADVSPRGICQHRNGGSDGENSRGKEGWKTTWKKRELERRVMEKWWRRMENWRKEGVRSNKPFLLFLHCHFERNVLSEWMREKRKKRNGGWERQVICLQAQAWWGAFGCAWKSRWVETSVCLKIISRQ